MVVPGTGAKGVRAPRAPGVTGAVAVRPASRLAARQRPVPAPPMALQFPIRRIMQILVVLAQVATATAATPMAVPGKAASARVEVPMAVMSIPATPTAALAAKVVWPMAAAAATVVTRLSPD